VEVRNADNEVIHGVFCAYSSLAGDASGDDGGDSSNDGTGGDSGGPAPPSVDCDAGMPPGGWPPGSDNPNPGCRRSLLGLSTEQVPVSAYVGSSKNRKDRKGRRLLNHDDEWVREGFAQYSANKNTLTFILCAGQALEPLKKIQVSFNITNPDIEQDAVPLFLSALGISADRTETFLIPPQVMAASQDAIFGVLAGASPLKLVIPMFPTRAMGQTNPFATNANVLRLTLAASVALLGADGAEFTISGLVEKKWAVGTVAGAGDNGFTLGREESMADGIGSAAKFAELQDIVVSTDWKTAWTTQNSLGLDGKPNTVRKLSFVEGSDDEWESSTPEWVFPAAADGVMPYRRRSLLDHDEMDGDSDGGDSTSSGFSGTQFADPKGLILVNNETELVIGEFGAVSPSTLNPQHSTPHPKP